MEGGLETREIINMKERVDEDEEEEEEQICRICYGPGDSENPLQYPCACSGSMKFVHPKCFLRWMKQRITPKCEVCKHKYSVYRVYAENTPTRLPLREFVGGIAMKACHVPHFCLRFCFSSSQQLLVAPLIAFWTWRLSLVRSLSEIQGLVHSHMSPSTVMMDWLYGSVINVFYMIWMCVFALIMGLDNEIHIAHEIGEGAGEPQAIAGVRNEDHVAPGLRLLVAPLLRGFRRVVVIAISTFDVPLRRTGIFLVKIILFYLITNGVLILVPFSLGRIILHCLSWLFFVASSIFMLFIESALYIGNNSVKNASHAVTNLSAEIQNDCLRSCAIEVVVETLAANSTGPGEASSSVCKPLSVYRSSGLYDGITLATGYTIVVSLVFVCSGIPMRTVASKIRYYVRVFLRILKYPFFLIIHLGVIPSVYGWWLDVCTITMLGNSFSDRVEFFSKFPLLSSSMHWAVGIIYMFQIHISTSLFQRVLRKEVLEFLQNLADPISIILHGLTNEVCLQASRFLFSIAVNGILMIYLVYLPVTLAILLAPTIIPLHISVSEPFTEIPVVMLLLQLCLPYAIELRETVADLIHQWVTSVCCVLGLSDFLCSRPGHIGGQYNVKVEREQDEAHDGIAAQDPKENTFTSQNFDGVENCASDPSDNGYALVLHVVLLVVLAWITWLLFSSSLIIVSLPLGHVLFSFISNLPITHGIECNDLYAFFIANISIWTSFTGARYFIRHFKLKAGITHLRFRDFCKLFCNIVESRVILSLWIIVIPVLIGLLFEFSFMVPVRALVVKAPPLLLCQDWAVGFFFFKLWRTLVFAVLLNHKIVLADESWRTKLERVRHHDFLKLPGSWMLQEILIPIVMNLLMSLCLPYVFARWIIPSFGFSLTVCSTVNRFTWIAYLTIIVLFSCAKRFPVWITSLHNPVRDDLYSSLGLQNFGEAAMECKIEIGKLVRWISQSQER
ncbi:probable E3 ubiquitin ligase SUD1 isoform X1 [Papaver somniferum]|uniref:probable E3 ubiquitin ligase SUD1 isoform X1 n=1 Tax=Papaver somniferum TaxID=3469 RepID=UPI000E7045EA|nr:probable E3 ubiquitin ligase SUD1 isoform X1 [Papaver somniferum]